MTREQLKALGLTDDQIEGVMKQHGIDTQGFNATLTQNNTELTRLKDIEGKYNALLANPPKDEPKGEPEDPQLAEALKKIAELEEANVRKDIQTYAIAKGLSGEDAENVLKAFASNLDLAKGAIDSIANVISARETAAADAKVKELAKNIDEIVIKKGKRPLHGTKLFVSTAISLSLGESIILQPITPHALHPKPIHIVRACFP